MKPEIQKQKGNNLYTSTDLSQSVFKIYERMGFIPSLTNGGSDENIVLLTLTAKNKDVPLNLKGIKVSTQKSLARVDLVCVNRDDGEGNPGGSIIFPVEFKPRD